MKNKLQYNKGETGTFYHGTDESSWKLIQEERCLWGYRLDIPIESAYRYTYLTPEIEVAKSFGDIILEVKYKPVGVDGTGTDNYGFEPPAGQHCWQFSVFVPIPLKDVKRIK